MRTTGRASIYDEVEQNPSRSFLIDMKKDIKRMEEQYTAKEVLQIKKDLIKQITESL